MPVQVHKGFIGVFIEVSRLRDTLNISAIQLSWSGPAERRQKREMIYIFSRFALLGREDMRLTEEGGDAAIVLKQNKLHAFAFRMYM